jgi:endonuclease/exonuclease/phosphatase family metal-dependent hydrolase
MARWMAAANPDVILLQEVMGSTIASKYKAELEAAMPGTTWSYFYRSDANANSTYAQGLAILTRLPILTTASIAYARCPDAQIQQRSAIAVSVPVNGRNVTLFSTHLSSYSGTADYACRLSQAKQLTSWAANFSSPQLITGDLNESESGGALMHLRTVYDDAWKVALASGRATAYPDNLPSAGRTRSGRIDFVLKTKGTAVMDVLAAQIPDTRDFTNDRAIAAEGKTSWAPHNYAPRASDHEMLITTVLVK